MGQLASIDGHNTFRKLETPLRTLRRFGIYTLHVASTNEHVEYTVYVHTVARANLVQPVEVPSPGAVSLA